MFWRFLPLTTNDVTFISIDLDEDSLESQGITKDIINKWLQDDRHLFMRTIINNPWPWPKTHVTGKAWGRKQFLSQHPMLTSDVFDDYKPKTLFGSDEMFIADHIYPFMQIYGLYTVFPHIVAKIFFQLAFKHSQITHYDPQNETFVSIF